MSLFMSGVMLVRMCEVSQAYNVKISYTTASDMLSIISTLYWVGGVCLSLRSALIFGILQYDVPSSTFLLLTMQWFALLFGCHDRRKSHAVLRYWVLF